jgi:hypothetical protein
MGLMIVNLVGEDVHIRLVHEKTNQRFEIPKGVPNEHLISHQFAWLQFPLVLATKLRPVLRIKPEKTLEAKLIDNLKEQIWPSWLQLLQCNVGIDSWIPLVRHSLEKCFSNAKNVVY